MDPQTDLPDLVEDLEVNIDELSTVLAPLLSTPLSTTASSLPLLDKAKLYVLAAYAIESLLYSTLQASGVNAKEHAVFRELARLKGYFGKIKAVEDRSTQLQQPKHKLDVGAAARFIKHGLAGNNKYDLERAERMAKEKVRAKLKAAQINKKFDEDGEVVNEGVTPKKRGFEEVGAEAVDQDDEELLEGLPESEAVATLKPATKKAKLSVAAAPMDADSAPSPTSSSSGSKKKHKKRGKKQKDVSTGTSEVETQEENQDEAAPQTGEQDVEAESPAEPAKERKEQQPRKNKSIAIFETEALEVKDEDEVPPAPEDVEIQPESSAEPANKTRKQRGKKKTKPTDTSEAEAQEEDQDVAPPVPEEAEVGPESPTESPKKKRKQRGKKGKASSGIIDKETGDAEAKTIIPARAPKTRSETFNALLDRLLVEKQTKGKCKAKATGK